MSNHRFDFDDELQQSYSSLQDAKDNRTDEQKNSSKIAIYDHSNPEIANMEMEALNLINDSGAPTLVYRRSDDTGQTDDGYNETTPQYLEPDNIKAIFKPEQVSLSKVKWGIDVNIKMTLSYSRAYLLGLYGSRLIKIGDVVAVPHNTLIQTQSTEYLEGKVNRLDKFRIINSFDAGNFNYRWLYWNCIAEPISGDIVIIPRR
jgi:hypothetical protein